MYSTDHIFPVIPIKHLVNQYGEPTMPHKLKTGTKYSLSKLRVLFGPFVVLKSTTHVYTKALDMCHQLQNNCGIFVGIPKNTKGYLVYVPSIEKIVSSHEIVFEETVSSLLAYTSRPWDCD